MKRIWVLMILVFAIGLANAELLRVGPGENSLWVISSNSSETVLQYRISNFERQRVDINGEAYNRIRLPKEGISQDKGMPELPVYNRSIIIDGISRMKLEVYDLEYLEMKLPVAPSKGVITRDINPETVPYTFAPVYGESGFYPQQIAKLSEPYILRDFRGITIQTAPFAYDPQSQTLRIYTGYKVRVYADGIDNQNVLTGSRDAISRDFAPIYENHFVNWNSYRYTPVSDNYGKLLVICHTNYLTQIAPYVNWKKQKGIQTELVEWSTIGTTAAQLQTYIQNRYNADNTIAYVQLVGDAPQIPSLSSGGGGSDPSFSLVAGSDMYPDIFIGRFSAETTAQVTAQVNKAIVYERDLTTSDNWLSKALGIASAEGGGTQGDNGESDITHMNLIRTDLLNYGYSTVDQVYDPGASASTVTTNVNAGRGFINYVGHGSDTSWVTTGFSSTNATALTNGNKTPFIMDVACVNGNFVSLTCFAEAWMRNANGGAVAIYASTINQSWNSPMRAQDEATDLLIAESKTTTGGLYYNASCKMMDIYGNTSGSDGVNMFKTWHIFGDASLKIRTKTPLAMAVSHPTTVTIGTTSVTVNTGVANAMVAITYNNTIYGVANANSSGVASVNLSNPPSGVLNYIVTATAFNRVTYVGTIQQIAASGPYMGVETVSYTDGNNSIAEYNENGGFSITFKNLGTSLASNVTATLSCSTLGITLTDNTETIASLAAGASILKPNAFGISVADNIANGLSASFTITMTSGTESWVHNFNQVFSAPALAFGSMTVSDPTGNNNGRLDPGETVTLIIPLNNSGGALSPAGTAGLSSATQGIIINTGSAGFTSITAGGTSSLSFSVSAASSITLGTVASFNFTATAGAYTASKNETQAIGLIQEDFETGTFNSYPWVLAGTLPWTVANTDAHSGTYTAKSGAVSHSQESSMETTRILTASGNLSFWYKVSSESTYDFLKFYIDGVQQGSWSGTVDWTQANYTLSAGTRVLKWVYSKDGSVSSGSDCAWVDDIIFPASTSPNPFFAPRNLSAVSGNGSVALSWQAPVSGSPTGYKIFRNSSLLTTVTGLSYTDNAVENETSYSYYLKAVYTGGESDPTETVTAMPTAIIPTEVIIGTGTSATGTSDGSPINIYYESLHGQSVYTAAEMAAAGVTGPCTISQIGFYVATSPTIPLPDFKIRMKHTSSTNVASWQTATGMQTVYSTSTYTPVAGGFHMLTLSSPFEWNGIDNIVVDTAFNVLTPWSSTGTVRYTSVASGYRYVRVDDIDQTNIFTGGSTSSYRPNIKFVLSPIQTDAALIAVNPASISKTVNTGASTTAQLTITNSGNLPLTWTISDRSRDEELQELIRTGWLSFSPASGTIQAGANQVIELVLNSAGLANATYNKNLVIASNASNTPSLSVPVSFIVSDLVPNNPRFVAEWEPAKGSIIAYPFGQPYSLIRDLSNHGLLYVVVSSSQQSTCASSLSSNSVNMTNVRYINATTDSYWVRDYGPWTIFDANRNMKIVDFTYNRPRPNDNAANTTIATYLGYNRYLMEMSHTGGNIMTDGMGKAMSTELVLEENTSLTQSQINNLMQTYLGISEYQLYPDPNNTYIDHIDCWAKLLDVDKVIIRSVPSSHAQYAAIEAEVARWQSKTSSYGTPYKIYRVYTPNDEPYSNSYIMNKRIYVPQMGTANDAAALAVYRNAMPGYTVIGYSHTNYESTDALHCRVNTVYDDQMIALRHTPPTSATATQALPLGVTISHGNPLSSTYVAWKNGYNGTWQNSNLSLAGATWSTTIISPALGDTIYYWINASDTTGRSTTLPLCAASDPFKLVVNIPAPNSAPTIDLPPGWAFDKNSSLSESFAAYISDPDNDPLVLTASGNSNIIVQINGHNISFSTVANWIGSELITITVSDGEFSAEDQILITVNPVNLPVWLPVNHGSTPATLFAVVTINNIPAQINDLVAAFVGDECRGIGTINLIERSIARTTLDVNLASEGELVTFKIYAFAEDTIYLVPEVMPMDPGTTYGESDPVPLNGTGDVVLQSPIALLQSISGGARLSWDAVPFAGTYRIYACSEPFGTYSLIGTTNTLSWEINPSQSRMFYKVVAVQPLPDNRRSQQ